MTSKDTSNERPETHTVERCLIELSVMGFYHNLRPFSFQPERMVGEYSTHLIAPPLIVWTVDSLAPPEETYTAVTGINVVENSVHLCPDWMSLAMLVDGLIVRNQKFVMSRQNLCDTSLGKATQVTLVPRGGFETKVPFSFVDDGGWWNPACSLLSCWV